VTLLFNPSPSSFTTRAGMRAFDASYRDVLSANKASTRDKVFLGNFFAPAKKLPALYARKLCSKDQKQSHWIPACAGMTSKDDSEGAKTPDSGFAGTTNRAIEDLFPPLHSAQIQPLDTNLEISNAFGVAAPAAVLSKMHQTSEPAAHASLNRDASDFRYASP
jgi:hypothetical protein